MVDKFDVANALRETGLLMTVAGSNPFKAKAYLRGASSIESISEDIADVVKEKRLEQIPGIGPALAANIAEIVTTGEMKVLKKLREELPAGVLELAEVPGMTLPRIEKLHEALGIKTVEELEKACLEHKVSAVKGFGAKTEEKILEGIQTLRTTQKQMLLVHAMMSADLLLRHLRLATKSESVEIVGEIRRWHEVVDSIKILVQTNNPDRAWSALAKYALTTEILETTEKFCRVKLTESVVAEVHCANNSSTAMIKETGSESHWRKLQKFAELQGFELSEEKLRGENGKLIECKNEEAVFEKLGLPYIIPELREGEDEIELAKNGQLEDLIDIHKIQGMTHCHTTFSDGSHTVLDMARAAEKMGMKYLTITDHSPTAHYAGGLDIDELKRQWEAIESAQEKVKIKLLKGTESDILADGKLDYPDHILDKFDIIIASVHNRYKLDYESMTKRVLNCMKNPFFKVWGHPLGRLVLRRPPIDCDIDKILDVITESKAAIEINGDPYRLDLEPTLARKARERGIKFVISTDAHSIRDYQNLRFGVHMARRAAIKTSDVLNTLPFEKFKFAVKPS